MERTTIVKAGWMVVLAFILSYMPVIAQTDGGAGTGSGGTTTGAYDDDREDGFDWGILGLLGLAGLAGMKRRDDDRTRVRT